MKQEFITVSGKVIIEKNILLIRAFYFRVNWSIILKLIVPLLIWMMFIVLLFDEPKDSKWNFRIFMWGLMSVLQLPNIYEMLIQRSYSNSIPLNKIKSFEVKQDIVGYITLVIIKLKNGRNRTIKFRTLEKQYESFTELVSQHIIQPQFA
jgi:hypothetical protein